MIIKLSKNSGEEWIATVRKHIIKRAKVKDKERILKAVREKQLVTCKGIVIKIKADFSAETLQTRK